MKKLIAVAALLFSTTVLAWTGIDTTSQYSPGTIGLVVDNGTRLAGGSTTATWLEGAYLARPGTVTVDYYIRGNDNFGVCGQIYLNGTAQGTSTCAGLSLSGSFTFATINVTVNPGDVIGLYTWKENIGGSGGQVVGFGVFNSFPTHEVWIQPYAD